MTSGGPDLAVGQFMNCPYEGSGMVGLTSMPSTDAECSTQRFYKGIAMTAKG
jgi:hypothetical protein